MARIKSNHFVYIHWRVANDEEQLSGQLKYVFFQMLAPLLIIFISIHFHCDAHTHKNAILYWPRPSTILSPTLKYIIGIGREEGNTYYAV